MCVLTYIPTENQGFILTSNRDEAVSRVLAIPPKKYQLGGQYVFFPKDPQGDGTWIGSCGNFTLCLLNGGVEKHIPKPPYRQSRGKVILDFFEYYSVQFFLQSYSFNGIEPFTLVIIESQKERILHEIRWTGEEILYQEKEANVAHIWSSVTLYSPAIIQQRENWFKDFLQEILNKESLLDFHHFGGKGHAKSNLKVNFENQLKTVSITQYTITRNEFTIHYEDLIQEKIYDYRVFMEHEVE